MEGEQEQTGSQLYELARLAVKPWTLAEATKRVRTGPAIMASLLGYIACVALPFSAEIAAAGDPYRDFVHFGWEILTVGLVIAMVVTSLVWISLMYAALLARAFVGQKRRFRGEHRLRAILLAPFALSIPAVLWSIFVALEQAAHPHFGLVRYDRFGQKPDWLQSSFISICALPIWWHLGLGIGIVLAIKAIFDLGPLPTYMRDGKCVKCRYDLTGNTSGVCPECGTKVASVPEGVPE